MNPPDADHQAAMSRNYPFGPTAPLSGGGFCQCRCRTGRNGQSPVVCDGPPGWALRPGFLGSPGKVSYETSVGNTHLGTKLFSHVCEFVFEQASFSFFQSCVCNSALKISQVLLFRRSRLCCCCGCLSFIFVLLVFFMKSFFDLVFVFIHLISIVEFRRTNFNNLYRICE